MSGPPYIAGSSSPVEQPIRSVWSRSGATHERRWWGEGRAVKLMQNSAIVGNALEVSFDQAPGSAIGILTAKYAGIGPGSGTGGGTEAVETVDIQYTDATFPMHQNPTFIGLSTDKVQEIEKKTADKAPNTYTVGTLEYELYELRRRGVDSYRVQLPVVVWNRMAGPSYPAIADMDDVGKIFSTGALAWSIGVPMLFRVPTGNIGISAGDASIFRAGWMKTGQVSSASDGMSQITLRAEYGLWAIRAYQFA